MLAINGTEASVDQVLLNEGEFTGATGVALSPDGDTLYIAEIDNDGVISLPINSPGSGVFQADIIRAFGLGLSSNGRLYVTQAEDGINSTTMLNAENFFIPPSTLSIEGKSLTIGQFVGS